MARLMKEQLAILRQFLSMTKPKHNMDEKTDYPAYASQEAYSRHATVSRPLRPRGFAVYYRDTTLRRLCVAMCLTLTAWLMTRTIIASYRATDGQTVPSRLQSSDVDWVMVEKNSTKVALEAHIMSKCPDAKDCLQKLVVPAMEQINDKVDFQLSYIGR